MEQMKSKQLKEVVEQIKQEIMRSDCSIGAVSLTWTVYGWEVEVTLYEFEVDIYDIKMVVFEAMDKAGFEVVKITLEV